MPFPNDDTKFKKGQSGNPNGRPAKTVSEFLKELGNAKKISFDITITDDKGKETHQKGEVKSKSTLNNLVAIMLFKKAMGGDLRAIQELLDRTEGKPVQVNLNKNENEDTVSFDFSTLSEKDLADLIKTYAEATKPKQ